MIELSSSPLLFFGLIVLCSVLGFFSGNLLRKVCLDEIYSGKKNVYRFGTMCLFSLPVFFFFSLSFFFLMGLFLFALSFGSLVPLSSFQRKHS